MGIAVSFKLINKVEQVVEYSYGLEFDGLEGFFRIDMSKVKGKEYLSDDDVYIELVKPCDGEKDGCPLLGMVFVKILRYYQEHGEYPESGGYYS